MVKGGGYSRKSMRAIHLVSVLVTPVLALYVLLIVAGAIQSAHFIGDPIAIAGLALFWVVLSCYYYIKEAKSRTDQGLRLVVYHIITLAMFAFVMGFSQPFAAFFVLLVIASQLYFGRKGLVYSAGSLVIAGAIDIIIRYPYQETVVYDTGLPVLSILFLSFAIVGIINSQETKRQALVHSRERERLQYDRVLTIMNNLTDAAFSTDENGKISLYNAASLDLLDTNGSLKGHNINEFFKLTTTEGEATNLYDILKGTKRATRRDDLNHTYPDGESIRLEISYAPIRSSYSLNKNNDEHGGFIIIMRDVTKQKSLEEERDEFISVVSHELRTPITIVEGTLSNLKLLMKQPKQPDTKVLRSTVTTAYDQVLYLAKMVNDLSTLSRAERGVADAPEQINVSDLLHAVHRRYEPEARAKKLHLNLDLGPRLGTVNVSRLYLEELLQNFVTNAIKYTNEGNVTIAAKRTKNIVEFSVKDTGLGISRTDQNKIFNKFYRSEDYRIRETSGTGLGLYVSTKLAHKLQTNIDLKSRLNHGSTFSFELPTE